MYNRNIKSVKNGNTRHNDVQPTLEHTYHRKTVTAQNMNSPYNIFQKQ
jgi:hypothetical protein